MSNEAIIIKGKQNAIFKSKVNKNPHLQTRVEYLHKAAQYLSEAKKSKTSKVEQHTEEAQAPSVQAANGDAPNLAEQPSDDASEQQMNREGSPRYLVNQARSVALKAQIRLPQDIKRNVCKKCDAPLVSAGSSSTRLENISKGKKKPWADVLVVTCLACHCQKRFPIGATRQLKRKARQDAEAVTSAQETSAAHPGQKKGQGFPLEQH